MWRGASGSCSHRIALPSGAREGSKAVGWPRQIVGSAGSMPRSASFTAFDTPSSPGVRCSSATLPSSGSRHCGGSLQRIVDLHVALAVDEALDLLALGCGTRPALEQAAIELGRRHGADDALRRGDLLARCQHHAGGAARLVDGHLRNIGTGADLAAMIADQTLEGREDVLRSALDDGSSSRLEREGDDLRHLPGIGALGPQPRSAAPRAP